MLTTEPGKGDQTMMLLEATAHTAPHATTETATAAYHRLAPVFTQLRGTTLPVAVRTTALGTVGTNGMDVNGVFGSGRAFAGLGWQPIVGSEKKRHGATRGRPPREHRKGLDKARSELSRPRIPHQGSRPFCLA